MSASPSNHAGLERTRAVSGAVLTSLKSSRKPTFHTKDGAVTTEVWGDSSLARQRSSWYYNLSSAKTDPGLEVKHLDIHSLVVSIFG